MVPSGVGLVVQSHGREGKRLQDILREEKVVEGESRVKQQLRLGKT